MACNSAKIPEIIQKKAQKYIENKNQDPRQLYNDCSNEINKFDPSMNCKHANPALYIRSTNMNVSNSDQTFEKGPDVTMVNECQNILLGYVLEEFAEMDLSFDSLLDKVVSQLCAEVPEIEYEFEPLLDMVVRPLL
ncbi:hypothetical protein RF11_11954 [Thelohanellus kitauei]|uniref:Uncharacterized protein n=1 Tax=Thelohanellus kitauei TaxID=669202 RepID=A0A0C2MX23_THEKT|nr:hypothetical protein RF11_11954 [Thelohanellus kitauei]